MQVTQLGGNINARVTINDRGGYALHLRNADGDAWLDVFVEPDGNRVSIYAYGAKEDESGYNLTALQQLRRITPEGVVLGINLGRLFSPAPSAPLLDVGDVAKKPAVKTRYFTFGSAQRHEINGIALGGDTIVRITADNPRTVMTAFFGRDWSFEYHGIVRDGSTSKAAGFCGLNFWQGLDTKIYDLLEGRFLSRPEIVRDLAIGSINRAREAVTEIAEKITEK